MGVRRHLRVLFGRVIRRARGFRRYRHDLRTYCALNTRPSFEFRKENAFPIYEDFFAEAGRVSGHYFHQDLWAARLIHQRQPKNHLDIGSRFDGFIAHLLVFMPVTVIDFRSMSHAVEGMEFVQGNATSLDDIEDGSVDSLSSLHAVEHFGLGRYGDPIDPEATFKAISSMGRVLAPGGRLYLSTPIGRERLAFNAHRIFAAETILRECPLALVSFAAVDDEGDLHLDTEPSFFRHASYSCGLFEFTKP